MYMVTIAAMIRNRVLLSDDWNASAAPWNFVSALIGMPISRCAARIALTASPSDAPGARLNEIVAAGNWPRWLIARGPDFSTTRAMLLRRTCCGAEEIPDACCRLEVWLVIAVGCPTGVIAFVCTTGAVPT